tara:strand:- start:13498 stop:14175 length:678 start_codon:yes stop_codon:yes gene_type:complete
MTPLKNKIQNWIFDLDNTLYSAESGIFQQVHVLMGEYVSKKLKLDINKAKEIQKKYFIKHGTTLRGLMDNHNVDPDDFLKEVHKLDYSIVGPNIKLNRELAKLNGKKIIYTNANLEHANNILSRLNLKNMFDEIFDIKMANYIPKPEIQPYKEIIDKYTLEPSQTAMFDDITKNLVPAKKLGFTSIWIDIGEENISDNIESSKNYLDFKTNDLTLFLDEVNRGIL